MKHLTVALAAVVAVACSDNGSAPLADPIGADEKAAVQAVLTKGLAGDTLYPILSALVFPFILSATPQPAGSDTTKLVGIQLDVNATQDTAHVTSQLTPVPAWGGVRPAAQTADSAVLVIGAGRHS